MFIQADITVELNSKIESDDIVKSFTEKRQLLDDLTKQRAKLEELRILRDHHVKELKKIQEKADHKKEKEDAQAAKVAKANEEYETLLQELSKALNFVVSKCEENGAYGLIKDELDAFRKTQGYFFDLMNKLFIGREKLQQGINSNNNTSASS